MKRWLISNCNGVVILCNKSKIGSIFKTEVLCFLSDFFA